MFAFLQPQRARSRDLSHDGETFVLFLCHRGTPGQAGHTQVSTGGRNQLVIPNPLGLPSSVAASPASKNEEAQRRLLLTQEITHYSSKLCRHVTVVPLNEKEMWRRLYYMCAHVQVH